MLLLGFISAATNFFLPNIRVEEADQIVIVEKRLAFPPELSAPGRPLRALSLPVGLSRRFGFVLIVRRCHI